METTENNKLIAEFMGMKYSDKRSFNNGEWTHSIRSLSKFQSSWDWLMPVVREILTLIDINQSDYDASALKFEVLDDDIQQAYKEVIEFIKKYN